MPINPDIVRVGAFVRTSYGTGPYVIKTLSGPCTCVAYHDHLNGIERPSKPHYHMLVHVLSRQYGDYYLGGYTLDGRSVWCKDRLFDASQLELFGERNADQT